jgi:hypothetical protein
MPSGIEASTAQRQRDAPAERVLQRLDVLLAPGDLLVHVGLRIHRRELQVGDVAIASGDFFLERGDIAIANADADLQPALALQRRLDPARVHAQQSAGLRIFSGEELELPCEQRAAVQGLCLGAPEAPRQVGQEPARVAS